VIRNCHLFDESGIDRQIIDGVRAVRRPVRRWFASR
jgi:hypothetical protein